MAKYVCQICGFVYDEDVGISASQIPAHTKWEDLDENWVCPICKASKTAFKREGGVEVEDVKRKPIQQEWTNLELSILLSNLAKGCEKQYLVKEQSLFHQLADYYQKLDADLEVQSLEALGEYLDQDLRQNYPVAHSDTDQIKDRGAKRALVWSEKSTNMLQSLIERYQNEKETMVNDNKVFVCEICGFVYIGKEAPEICPVCKVPRLKIHEVKRGLVK